MATNSDIADGIRARRVGLYRLRGAEGCPPRCPHFFDKEGTPLRITSGMSGKLEALIDL